VPEGNLPAEDEPRTYKGNIQSIQVSDQPLSIAALRSALSVERLAAYATDEDSDQLDAVARYIWNVALACAIQPSLHALEITLRNNLFNGSRKIVDESRLSFREVPCWLDADPSLLLKREAQTVEEAKALLSREKKEMTPGRLISKLGLGFWVSLCQAPYDQGRPDGPRLWPEIVKYSFPFVAKQNRTRSIIFHRLNELRELRNRASHHEPIWDRNFGRAERRLLEVLSWMNRGMAEALQRISTVEEVHRAGPKQYRSLAQELVRLAPE